MSKWGGIKELAIMCASAGQRKGNEFSAKMTVNSIEAELRRRVEPLLDKTLRVSRLRSSNYTEAEYLEANDELEKELKTWK